MLKLLIKYLWVDQVLDQTFIIMAKQYMKTNPDCQDWVKIIASGSMNEARKTLVSAQEMFCREYIESVDAEIGEFLCQ